MSSKSLPVPLCCRPAGDRAVAVELGDRATPEINARVHALATQVRQAKLAGVVATVPSYRSLLVYYEPALLTYDDLTQWLSTLSPDNVVSQAVRRWQLPALYGGICSQDLQALAGLAGLDGDEVVRLHAAQVYRVYMVGFSPGFSYLGELPAALQVPRKSAPVAAVPRNAIQLAAAQTAVSSMSMPSGWYVIGRIPLEMYDPAREDPFLLRAGDEVQFTPVGERAFDDLVQSARAGTLQPKDFLQ